MRDWLRSLIRHWVSVALFLAYWLVAFVLCARYLSGGGGGDWVYLLQILAPVVAGGITAFGGGSRASVSVLAALVGILDFNVLLAISYAHFPPSTGRLPAWEDLLISIPLFGGIAAALGLGGAAIGLSLRR